MQNPKRILIVDDEKFVTDTLEGFFLSKGYSIFKAVDGEETLKIIRNEALDLVILDIKLPKVNGIEILRILRSDYPAVKVIVMTAYDIEYKKQIDEIGCDAFFLKPLLIDELMEKIEELLSGENTTGRAAREKVRVKRQIQEKPKYENKSGASPSARILIVSPRCLISDLLKDYFSDKDLCAGNYEVSESGLDKIEKIKQFQPDIILLDVAFVGMLGEFGLTLMELPRPPKEIILFGDPAIKWEEVETLIKRGTKFIEMPHDIHDQKYPIRDTVERLNSAIKEVCLKHALLNKEGH